MLNKHHHIHMVGIGGSGMSGIAEVLLTLGHHVTGSDAKLTTATTRLKRRGAKIFRGHARAHLNGAEVVVVSSAINGTNPEVAAAKERGIPIVPRAEMLAELMRLKHGIAVAGTHGKTTTTAMIGAILSEAGLDPTIVIGGRVKSLRANARLGKGQYLVAETDESDRSFLLLSPVISVVTNIDPEHMECYRDFADLQQAFVDFANKVPFYGAVIACTDHPVVRRLAKRFTRRVITYGTKRADYVASHIRQQGAMLTFDVLHRGETMGSIAMTMVGKHYALNALAAIAVAREVGIAFPVIRRALKNFKGVARRFEILRSHDPIVVDDYGHHPVEIAATINAARSAWPSLRLVVVMQPHRYTRLRDHFDAFVRSVRGADVICITNVYAASEKPLAGTTGEKLWQQVKKTYPRKQLVWTPTGADVLATLPQLVSKEDLVLFLGAGDVTALARTFTKGLTSRS
ncbi:MAG: UDP-N-acetylmuramate--L-alanine ligase [Deltaproteobacteria bacterium]|nr:UDP-N-acetylmuramate--L-alanine ligase [Deltaproteobacteria bacterium]